MADPAAILVVEDDPVLRMNLCELLDAHGYLVVSAASADEGLNILLHRADVATIITDIVMPGTLDGLGLVSEIRRRWPSKHIIVASGRMPAEAAANAPGTRYLAKPFDEASLVRALAATSTAG